MATVDRFDRITVEPGKCGGKQWVARQQIRLGLILADQPATGTLPPPQTLLCLDHRFRASSLKHLAEAESL